ncbi:nucleotide exchange factor GrpE [Nocardioides eburneiflavus]|nr:nucleotide exchange factor GrpE [Nocardioides eburneiflavus]
MTDRPDEPATGPEAYDLPEGEPTAAPSPEGGFGDVAGEAPVQPFDTARPSPAQEPTEVEEQVAGDAVAGDGDGDTEEDDLAAMKGSLADLTNDLQRLQAEYANYRKRVDRDRQLVAETAAYKALTPVVEVLDTIDRAKDSARSMGSELDDGFKAVADQLERVVAAAGLVRFGEPGDAFDPTLHEALSHLGTDAEVEVTTVKHVAKGGYRMGDRVVRAAQVLVVDPADA